MARGGFYSVDSLRGVHVVVVDDEAESRQLLVAVLEYCGALVTTVGSAEEAMQVMKRVKPDALIVDLTMPDKDGIWFLRAVRALKPEDGGVVPAIAITARAVPDDRERGAAAGFNGYVTKPLNPWELCRLVTSLVMPS